MTTTPDTLTAAPARRTWFRRGALAIAALAVLGGGWHLMSQRNASAAQPRFVTEAVSQGPLKVTVTANGTLQPTHLVNIGSELSGTVSKVLVDVNDVVKRGQPLLELDRAKLTDQVQRSRAALAEAQAKARQTTVALTDARRSLARLEDLRKRSAGQLGSQADLETAQVTVDKALADQQSAEAAILDARAALSTDETNLAKAVIRAPVDGVILTRAVEPGNAVAASLQAVTLFTLAEDLHKLQIQVAIDEADVGTVQVGQPAEFTVAAWPRRHYPARIVRVAYGSTTTDNVVTYTALLDVDNSDLSLRPGMTSTVSITAAQREQVLRVPNTALRFTPRQGVADAATAGASGAAPGGAPNANGNGNNNGGSLVSKLMPRPPGGPVVKRQGAAAGGGSTAPATPAERKVWVLDDAGHARAVPVVTGLSDGHLTEVAPGTLQAGQKVITDQLGAAK